MSVKSGPDRNILQPSPEGSLLVVHQPESSSRFNPHSLLLFSWNGLKTFSPRICVFSV